MSLKDDLIRSGYFPENLPPPFHTEAIAQYFLDSPSGYLSDGKLSFRSADYSASKRGIGRRAFSAIHPITAHDLAEFLQTRAPELDQLFEGSTSSYSIPQHTPHGDRALEIASHARLEIEITVTVHKTSTRI